MRIDGDLQKEHTKVQSATVEQKPSLLLRIFLTVAEIFNIPDYFQTLSPWNPIKKSRHISTPRPIPSFTLTNADLGQKKKNQGFVKLDFTSCIYEVAQVTKNTFNKLHRIASENWISLKILASGIDKNPSVDKSGIVSSKLKLQIENCKAIQLDSSDLRDQFSLLNPKNQSLGSPQGRQVLVPFTPPSNKMNISENPVFISKLTDALKQFVGSRSENESEEDWDADDISIDPFGKNLRSLQKGKAMGKGVPPKAPQGRPPVSRQTLPKDISESDLLSDIVTGEKRIANLAKEKKQPVKNDQRNRQVQTEPDLENELMSNIWEKSKLISTYSDNDNDDEHWSLSNDS